MDEPVPFWLALAMVMLWSLVGFASGYVIGKQLTLIDTGTKYVAD